MGFGETIALFGAMAVLAAVPSVSVLAVSARSVSNGFVHGALTALGVVAGDVIFVLLAVFGLALLAQAMGDLFLLVEYLGGAYVVWLGVAQFRARAGAGQAGYGAGGSRRSSFMSGLLITLGDQKAVLFYLGFMPAFVDLATMSYLDVGAIIAAAVLAVGGVKLGYAYAADRAGAWFGAETAEKVNIVAAGVMIAAGLLVIANAWRARP